MTRTKNVTRNARWLLPSLLVSCASTPPAHTVNEPAKPRAEAVAPVPTAVADPKPEPAVSAVRLIAPLSGFVVNRLRPSVTVELGTGTSGAVLSFCADLSCDRVLTTVELRAEGDGVSRVHAAPTRDLPPGRVFVRATATQARTLHSSATWQLEVRHGRGIESAKLGFSDVNGDSRDDIELDSKRFGVCIPVGDLTGDGFSDFICAQSKGPQGWETPVLALGAASGAREGARYPVLGESFGDADALGDIDGDGFGDIAWTAANAPSALILSGSPDGLRPRGSVSRNAPSFGALGQGADLDGDGFSDYVGSTYGSLQPPRRAYVHLGSATGLAAKPSFELEAPDDAVEFGSTVLTHADFDGDGYADVAIGAYRAGTDRQGRVFVYRGGKQLAKRPSQELAAPLSDIRGRKDTAFGIELVGFDADGDGYDDLMVGSGCYDRKPDGSCATPRRWLYRGDPKGLGAAPVVRDPEIPVGVPWSLR